MQTHYTYDSKVSYDSLSPMARNEIDRIIHELKQKGASAYALPSVQRILGEDAWVYNTPQGFRVIFKIDTDSNRILITHILSHFNPLGARG